MKKNRVVFLHPFTKDVESMVKYMKISNQDVIDSLVWDEEDPEYVFASEHIYRNKDYFKRLRSYYKDPSKIFIFHAGEAMYPDMNIFDYAISYVLPAGDHAVYDSGRVFHLPTMYHMDIPEALEPNPLTKEKAMQMLSNEGRKFCNFIYSNGNPHPMRDKLFFELSKYKLVDSLGRHLNNVRNMPDRYDDDWLWSSVRQKSEYKFSIAAENAIFEGYTTEKFLSSLLAHTVPIYWGNPRVAEVYNPKAFINCHDYGSLDEVIQRVIEIDQNDDLWAEMVSQPWMTQEQADRFKADMEQYRSFLYRLFSEDRPSLIRRPSGTHPDLYCVFFFRHRFHKTVFERAVGKLKRAHRSYIAKKSLQ